MTKKRDVKYIIGDNITELRKEHKLTQAELGEKLGYTDKAISKWELGESTPNVDSLLEMANLFNVTVDYFFHEADENKKNYILHQKKETIKNILNLVLYCVFVYTVAVFIFVFAALRKESNVEKFWISFVYALPICAALCMYFFSKRKMDLPIGYMIASSIFLWSLLATAYLQMFILYNTHPFYLFFAGVPLQAIVIISHYVRR